ncbi:MAG: GNAT family N-acetyltransferase [Anaerolineae bacterium]|nr:GNAT family N-acetyltransferase [Anaerolineae bacterium]
MIEVVENRRQQLGALFEGAQGGLMPDAVLDGCMGRALADSACPKFAVLELPAADVVILGGDLNQPAATDYLRNLSKFTMLFANAPDFEKVTKHIHRGKWVAFERFAFSTDHLSWDKMRQFQADLPDGFHVKKLDVDLARQLAQDEANEYANHHGINFDSPEDFVARGGAYCICEAHTIACVASSFAVCAHGIEIQIDTHPDYRRRGLGTVAAAYLIAHCLENDLEPGWDAATEVSAELAKKLGYTPQATYQMYVFTNSRLLVLLRNTVGVLLRRMGKKRPGQLS